MKLLRIGFSFLLFNLAVFNCYAQSLVIGVAGGFKPAMEPLVKLFEQRSGQQVSVSYASVGVLYAQILQGAPFDLFISADSEAPLLLEQQGLGVKETRRSYAVSELVLWSVNRDIIDGTPSVLYRNDFKYLAIPNPKVGVHGKAAIEVLDKLGLTDLLRKKLVEGKNVLQTFQHIESTAADLGFISMSLIHRGEQPIKGSYWIVPDELHAPLVQQAICLTNASSPHLAQTFLDFMFTPEAQEIITFYGYRIPVQSEE
jgi:molybdate transport system substrate-binding protein